LNGIQAAAPGNAIHALWIGYIEYGIADGTALNALVYRWKKAVAERVFAAIRLNAARDENDEAG